MKENTTDLLKELGLSELEAKIYTDLVGNNRATGYKIAQRLGKPAANTYKALELLQKKGLVVADAGGKVKNFSALPISEYMDQLENIFLEKRKQVENSLKSLATDQVEEGLFRLQNPESMYQRAKQMILQAREVVAVDICPAPLERLKESLIQIAKTHARVLVKVYSPISLDGCDVITADFTGSPFKSWPFEWLHLIIDAKEHLTALIPTQGNRLFQAVWCKNNFLSMTAHNGFFSEFLLTQVIESLYRKEPGSIALEIWNQYRVLATQNLSSIKEYINNLSG